MANDNGWKEVKPQVGLTYKADATLKLFGRDIIESQDYEARHNPHGLNSLYWWY